ncbi:hypothetical protein NIES2111_61570 (plasmid) [Nostoc sp. NIES-2111]|nr:hypothetical protein NIES2111_61570 [Nostoc sp. NIES-2111]
MADITGTAVNDFLLGTKNIDSIFGADGNDILIGLAGDDFLSGDLEAIYKVNLKVGREE